jgi:crossover junction endodeoxyribonuclease RusA
MIYRLLLDYPPSVNHIYRRRGRRVFCGPHVAAWRHHVAVAVLKQISTPPPRLTCDLQLRLSLSPPISKKDYDIDNPLKATLDALTKANVWRDDSQVKLLVVSMNERRKAACMWVEIETMLSGANGVSG